jgi:hypothetical protein
MAKVRWDLPGTRAYNVGVDRGVLYLPDGSGVPWSGLMSLVESAGADLEEVSYFDGEKYVGEQQTSDFAAALAAVTFPDEFLQFDGYDSPEPGLLVGNQPSKSFSLSYRTLVGSDTEGTDLGYKIHILYNLTAVSTGIQRTTLAETVSPDTFGWNLTSRPEPVTGYRPTAHVVIDSRYIQEELLQDLEGFLYGTDSLDADLPSLDELVTLVDEYGRLIIIDHGDGTWTARGPTDQFTIVGDEFTITDANSIDVDANTFIVSSDPVT